MSLSQGNKNYLDRFANPRKCTVLIEALKTILTDANIAAIRTKVKTTETVRLTAWKAKIDAELNNL